MSFSLANFSTPVKIVAALIAGAGLVGTVALLAGAEFWATILIGLVVVGLLVVGYLVLLKWIKKRKGESFGKDLSQAGKTSEVKTPEELARLDDLMKTFLEGIDKFRKAGKDLYSVPWYLVIGESGAGKTEAIRRVVQGVGHPPGLQDPAQGVGGTVNMHWWFTNKAVVLDTAGKMVFSGVQAGQTKEWALFLNLLRKHRRNCPINGLILVIPADGFFLTEKDRNDGLDLDKKIQKRSGEMAAKLELIKQELAVRFPVYLMITKADLIVGFREFFDDLDDPDLQHQILGWSKAGSLDEAFNPEAVERHLDTVTQRLLRRRLGLLLDPINPDDPQGRRLDEVDALYAFPNNLANQIGPPLRRYLEQIFNPSGWSEKELLFRGIYFTSSMREGAELDEEIASMLEVPVESLPEGRVWVRDRAFFLRDLFTRKVFAEQGLVTRAKNIGQLQRRRQGLLLGAGISGAALLIVLTFWFYFTLRGNIVEHEKFWETVRSGFVQEKRYSTRGWYIVGRKSRTEDTFIYRGKDLDLTPTLRKTLEMSRQPIGTPKIFWWLSHGERILQDERHAAHRSIIQSSVLEPLIGATAFGKMKDEAGNDPGGWKATSGKVRTLATLMEALSASDLSQLDLEAFLGYVGVEGFESDLEDLRHVLAETYKEDREASEAFLNTFSDLPEILEETVDHFLAFWAAQDIREPDPEEPQELLKKLKRLGDTRDAFGDAEEKVLAVDDPFKPDELLDEAKLASFAEGWKAAYGDFVERSRELEEIVESLRDDLKAPAAAVKAPAAAVKAPVAAVKAPVAEAAQQALLWMKLRDDCLKVAQPAFQLLLNACPEGAPGVSEEDAKGRRLLSIRAKLGAAQGELNKKAETVAEEYRKNLEPLVAEIRGALAGGKDAPHKVRATAYALADGATSEEEIVRALRELDGLTGEDSRLVEAKKASRFFLHLKLHREIGATISALPSFPDGFQEEAAKDERYALSTLSVEDVPLARPIADTFKNMFHADYLKAVSSRRENVEKLLKSQAGVLGQSEGSLEETFRQWDGSHFVRYRNKYIDYWTREALAHARATEDLDKWTDFRQVIPVRSEDVNRRLAKFISLRRTALRAMADLFDEEKEKEALEPLKADIGKVDKALMKTKDPGFNQDCNKCIRQWRGLDADSQAAARSICRQRPLTFLQSYLGPYDVGVGYWDSFAERGLTLISRDAQKQVAERLDGLQRDYKRFPLMKVSGRVTSALTRAELLAAHEEARKLGSGPADAREPGAAVLIGEGARINDQRFQRIDALLDDLCGVNLEDAKKAWFKQLKDVLAFLSDPKLRCEVVVLDQKEMRDRPNLPSTVVRHEFFEVAETSPGIGVEDIQQQNVDRDGLLNTGIAGRAKKIRKIENALSFIFYGGTPDLSRSRNLQNGFLPIAMGGSWGVIAAIHKEHAVLSPDKKTYEVPFKIEDKAAGRTYAYWVGFRFSREIPPEWPTESSWPVR